MFLDGLCGEPFGDCAISSTTTDSAEELAIWSELGWGDAVFTVSLSEGGEAEAFPGA